MSTTLHGQEREKVGSRASRKLRLQGWIPASIQGEGQKNRDISIGEEEFVTARRHHEHLFEIEFAGKPAETALVRELQWDPLGERILHVEFRRVIRGRETLAEVALEFLGHPKGGILNHLLTHVPVRALPSRIPDSLEIRVEGLSPGHPVLVGDIELPEGVSIELPADTQVAVVVVPRGEVEAAEPAVEAGEAAEESPQAPPTEEPG